jgi:hypothetical protein
MLAQYLLKNELWATKNIALAQMEVLTKIDQ